MTNFPMVLAALFAEVLLKPTANHGDHAFSDRAHAKTRDPRPAVWEKHFQTRLSWRCPQEKAGITPKPTTRDRLGENRSGTRLSWPSRFFPMALTPKPAAFDPRFGKNILKLVYHGDFLIKKRRLRQNRRPLWGNSNWNPFIMAIAKERAIRLAKPFGLTKSFGLVKP